MIDKLRRQGMHMANEAQALAGEPQGAGDSVYEALVSVLASCERGRAFLAEHARRSRQADTEMLLGALARIEAMLAEQRAQSPEPPPAPPALPPSPAPAPVATALAAVAARAMAAAESEMPEVKVIKAGSGPRPALFAGEDFATADATAPVDAAPETGASEELADFLEITEAAADTHVIAGGVPDEPAAPAAASAADALTALLALSDDERLALFS